MRVVFMHGAGNSGRAAWPLQAPDAPGHWVFLARAAAGDIPGADAARILDALGDGGHVVGASYGGLAAMLAAQADPRRVRSLVLAEPACLSIARGGPGVEAHVAALAPVFAKAADPAVSHREFSRLFAVAMGTPVPDLPAAALEENVSRLRALTAPWEIEVSEQIPRQVPTLVLTGNSERMYDEVASVLVRHGAEQVVIAGAGHRPQDDPAGAAAMARLWQRHAGRPSS